MYLIKKKKATTNLGGDRGAFEVGVNPPTGLKADGYNVVVGGGETESEDGKLGSAAAFPNETAQLTDDARGGLHNGNCLISM